MLRAKTNLLNQKWQSKLKLLADRGDQISKPIAILYLKKIDTINDSQQLHSHFINMLNYQHKFPGIEILNKVLQKLCSFEDYEVAKDFYTLCLAINKTDSQTHVIMFNAAKLNCDHHLLKQSEKYLKWFSGLNPNAVSFVPEPNTRLKTECRQEISPAEKKWQELLKNFDANFENWGDVIDSPRSIQPQPLEFKKNVKDISAKALQAKEISAPVGPGKSKEQAIFFKHGPSHNAESKQTRHALSPRALFHAKRRDEYQTRLRDKETRLKCK